MMRNTIKEKLSLLLTLFVIFGMVFAGTVYAATEPDTEVSFQINASYVELTYNESFDFNVKVKGLSCCDVTWFLDDDRYLTVDKNGVVKVKDDFAGSGYGDQLITLTAKSTVGAFYDTATIMLSEPPKGAILFNPNNTMNTAILVQLNENFVSLDYNDSFDFNVKVKGLPVCTIKWSLSDDKYLSVDNKGLVKIKDSIAESGLGEYVVTLTARSIVGNYYDTATIILNEPPKGAPIFFEEHLLRKLKEIDSLY